MTTKTSKARLDTDRTATGKTHLLSHVRVRDDGRTHSVCSGPADTYVGEDGSRVPLGTEEKNHVDDEVGKRLQLAKEERIKTCTKHHASFDAEAAKGLTSAEVRRRWPRWSGTCECGFYGVHYASWEHYIAGDW